MSESAQATESNVFLEGNFTPVTEEWDERSLEVIGTLPGDLAGNFQCAGIAVRRAEQPRPRA